MDEGRKRVLIASGSCGLKQRMSWIPSWYEINVAYLWTIWFVLSFFKTL
jgi:hypothetical protein